MLHRKRSIIKMVKLALKGEINPSHTESLDADDALYFWMMYSVGSSVAAGMLSRDGGKRMTLKANSVYDRLCRKLMWSARIYDEALKDRMKYSVVCSEIGRELRSDKPDAEKLLQKLIYALDCLTGSHVYLPMLKEACQNEEFKKECQKAIIAHGDELTHRFGEDIKPENYMHMLEDFYAMTVKDGAAERYKDFGVEPEEEPFEKFEGTSELIDSMERLYGTKR